MAGLGGQLLQILKLGAAISLAKRVHVIHVAHDPPGRLRKRGAVEAAQEASVFKPPVHVGHAGFDELAKLELAAAFCDLHRANLTRPRVHVLKKVAMDGPPVGEVEAP